MGLDRWRQLRGEGRAVPEQLERRHRAELPAGGPMAGKRIMFEGDSFVRNAFMGVLQLLRGREGDGSFTYPKSGWLAKGCGGLHLK